MQVQRGINLRSGGGYTNALAQIESVCTFKNSVLKGHCHEHNFKNSTAQKHLHHCKPINSGQVFVKLLYQCTEAKYRVISL